MLAMLTSLLVAVVGTPEATLVYVNELNPKTGAVALDLEGAYFVHAWAVRGADASLAVNGAAVGFSAPADGKTDTVWLDSEAQLALTPGAVALEAGEGVLAVAFTRAERWRGADALRHARVFSDAPTHVEDARAQSTRHTDTHFTMPPVTDLAAWEAFATTLRTRMRVACGLYPWPEKTPLNAKVFDCYDGDGFTVKKVYFEAYPGFLVTGNLYKPAQGDGPFPGVVCPHGHWEQGRLENGERGSVPARCITLARMGCVVFSYDMIGYVDSLQFPHNWGDKTLKLYGLHPFALQLWSSIRAVDFITSLPEVDARRIACTGASGGGTQTFALTAVDDRIRVCAPVNMISSNMQGGCICENAPLIRIDNCNMQIGAMAAPRPLLMVSATGDWTRETPRVEYPAIREVYGLYDAQDHLRNVHIDAPHNYNLDSRQAMYRFFGAFLLGEPARYAEFTEPAYELPPAEALRVFPDGKLPEGTESKEQVLERLKFLERAKWRVLHDGDQAAFRERFGGLYGDAYALELPAGGELNCERVDFEAERDYVLESWVLGRKGVGDQIPAVFFRNNEPGAQEAVLLVDGQGKAASVDWEKGGPGPRVQAALDAGKAVLVIDPFLIGEHHAPRVATERVNPGVYLDTFQPTDTLCRIQDVLTALAWLRARRDIAGTLEVEAQGDGAVWSVFAVAAVADMEPVKLRADFGGFDPLDDEVWTSRFYIPGVLGLGGLHTAEMLISPELRVIEGLHRAELTGAVLSGTK